MQKLTIKQRNRILRDYNALKSSVIGFNVILCALSGLSSATIAKATRDRLKTSSLKTISRLTIALDKINRDIKILDDVYIVMEKREKEKTNRF